MQAHDATQVSDVSLKVVRPTDRQTPDSVGGINRILVALSGPSPSAATIDVVAELAGRLPAEVIAYHVREWLLGLPGEWILGDEGPFDEGEQVASRVLNGMVSPLLARHVQSRGIAVVGRPGQVANLISDGAQILGAGLIIVELRRQSLLRRIFRGDVVRRLQRISSVPVVAVPQRMTSSARVSKTRR